MIKQFDKQFFGAQVFIHCKGEQNASTMEEAVEEILVCTILASSSIMCKETLNCGKRKRKCWVKDYFRERDKYGAYTLTLENLRTE